jgi:hypothetical protein
LPDRIEQILGHAGSFEDDAHESEERDGEQRLVRHDAPETFGQRVEKRPGERDVAARIGRQLHADEKEEQAVGGEREGGGVADDEKDHQPGEHDWRHVLRDQLDHQRISDGSSSSMSSRD